MLNLDSLRKHLTTLTDEAILEVKPEDLTDEAKAVYDAELASRGFEWPSAAAEAAGGTLENSEFPKPEEGELVLIASYETFSEARYAYQLLKHEQIPVWLAGTTGKGPMMIDPNAPMDLVTLPEHLETAQQLLFSEISEEELALLAEQAGDPEQQN